MHMVMIRLVATGFLFVFVSCIIYLAEKRARFSNVSFWGQQLGIGVCFGLLAVIATEFSVEIGGAAINIRDAAPLIAGMIFGGPAGIIAGLIGGVERWFASNWGVGTYTRTACSLAAILAGFVAAGVRKYLLDDKKPSWIYGLAVGVTMEVFHMLLVFLTKMSDIQNAFTLVRECALPMILANGSVVMASALAVTAIGKETSIKNTETKKLSQTFQLWLFVCVAIGFVITSLFTYTLQTRIAERDTEELLALNLDDVREGIHDTSDQNLLALTHKIAEKVTETSDYQALNRLAREYDVSEINLIDSNGIIQASTYMNFFGFDMASGAQSSEFLVLLNGETEYVQEYQPTTSAPTISRKYAGVSLPFGGFLQVGYNAERFQRDIDEEVVHAAKNRHVGQEGTIIICDASLRVVSDNEGYIGQVLDRTNIWEDMKNLEQFTPFEAEVHGIPSYCSYTTAEGYYILAVLPQSEAMFSRDIAVYLIMFMEILVFAALFAYIYFLIKRLIVKNLQKVNASLTKITGGDLDEMVDVRTNAEFASLSDDINSTVTTLKRYIAEAEARIDQELEYARVIQYSALPSVFPPYPNRSELDIYASMATAKEVGGDFYDFYLLGETKLAFMVADVSGKGIPAAMFMMRVKALIMSLVESGMDLSEAFCRANDQLCEGNDAEMFVTAWMGILDVTNGHLEFVNAGHNPPLIRRGSDGFEFLKTKANLVLAMMEEMPYKKHEIDLQPGDMIFLYTDGVTEAQNRNEELFGDERLLACLDGLGDVGTVSMEQVCKGVKEALDGFVGDAEQFDDITMLGIQYKGRG